MWTRLVFGYSSFDRFKTIRKGQDGDMASKRILTAGQLDPILESLPLEWGAVELSQKECTRLGITGGPIVGIAMSGVAPSRGGAPLEMYDKEVIAGITVLRVEDNPQPGEPQGNADHYVITATTQAQAPYLLYGPYRRQATVAKNAGIPHWHDESEFAQFVDSIRADLSE